MATSVDNKLRTETNQTKTILLDEKSDFKEMCHRPGSVREV